MTIVLANITNRTSTIIDSEQQNGLMTQKYNSSGISINKNNSDKVSLNSVDLQERNRFRENLLDFSDTSLKKNKRSTAIWNKDQSENLMSDNEEEFFDSLSSPSVNHKVPKVIKVPASKPGSPNLSMNTTSIFQQEENLLILQSPSKSSQEKPQKPLGNDIITHSQTLNSLASERPLNENVVMDQLESEKIDTDENDTNGTLSNLPNRDLGYLEQGSEIGSIISERPLTDLRVDEEDKEDEEEEAETNNRKISTCNTTVRFDEKVSYLGNSYYEEEEIIPNTLSTDNIENIDNDTTETKNPSTATELDRNVITETVESEKENSKDLQNEIDNSETFNISDKEPSESVTKTLMQTKMESPKSPAMPPALLFAHQKELKANPSTSITVAVADGGMQTQTLKSSDKEGIFSEKSSAKSMRSNHTNDAHTYSGTYQNDNIIPPLSYRAAYSSVASAYSQSYSYRGSSASSSRRYAKYQNSQMEYFESSRHSMRRRDSRRASMLRPSSNSYNAVKGVSPRTNGSFTDSTPTGRYFESVRDNNYNTSDNNTGFRSGRGSALSSRKTTTSEFESRSTRKYTKNPTRKLSDLRLFRSFTAQGTSIKDPEIYNTIDSDNASKNSRASRMSRISNTFKTISVQVFSKPNRSDMPEIDYSMSSNVNRNGTSSSSTYNHRSSRMSSRQVSRKSSILFFRVDEEERKMKIEEEDTMKKKLNSNFFDTVNSLKAHYQPDYDFDQQYDSAKFKSKNDNGLHKSKSESEVQSSVTIFWKKIKHFF